MNVAVIGCGHWGKNLVRNFAELGALASVSDPNIELAQTFSNQYNVPAFTFEETLATDCNGVVIAAPAPVHADLAEKAFAAGKHVYVEKPLAMTLGEADRIITAGKEADRKLMVGHLLQYHPVFAHLRGMVERGDLGHLRHMYSNRLSLGKIRAEEDVVWSFAPHDISMLLSLAQDTVASVYCRGVASLQEGTADSAILHLAFAGGLKAEVSCSWLHPVKEQKLVVIGAKGMAVFDDTEPWEKKLALYRHTIDLDAKPPLPEKAEVQYVAVPEGEPLKAECQYFLDVMAGIAPARTDGTEGRNVLQVLTAASASMQTGEVVYA